jgi:hypothetical protein
VAEQTPYERAIARIDATAELEPHRATILYDWPESDEFYSWAATCELSELLDWASPGRVRLGEASIRATTTSWAGMGRY